MIIKVFHGFVASLTCLVYTGHLFDGALGFDSLKATLSVLKTQAQQVYFCGVDSCAAVSFELWGQLVREALS